MTRRMLINAQASEEVRIAIISGKTLDTYEVAAAESGMYRGNIYRGLVTSVQPGLEAAFVDIGVEKDGLLRADDVVEQARHRKSDERHPRVDRILDKGQPLLVQVARDGVGRKGPLVTTNISLAGRYVVLMPYDDTRGVSRKVEDEELRSKIKERLAQISIPEGCGVIVRTNAVDQPKTALNRDLNALLRLWKKIRKEFNSGKRPQLVYSDQDLIVQALRDTLDSTVSEVLVDDDAAFAKARDYMQTFMPRAKTKLVRYAERMPLFSRYELEEQIDSIYRRKVELPAGGSIVIDGTEALTAIDVNSGRGSRGGSQEEMALNTNLQAAREVARQLRLRDIGGLVVVDFIDMRSRKNQRNLEKELRDAMKEDKARFTVGRISPNGLLEINRQRIKKALELRTSRPCPTCSGAGTIPSPEMVGLNLLRRIETRAVTGTVERVRVELHPELADAIQNGRRHEITALEQEFDIRVEIIAATRLHRSEEHLEWLKREPKPAESAPPPVTLSISDVSSGERRKAGEPRPETAGDGPEEVADSGDPGPDKPKKRRRGGRRRKRSGDDRAAAGNGAPADGAEGAPAATGAAEHAEPKDAEPTAEPSQDDGGTGGGDKPRKRRRGGRRRRKTPAQPTEPAAES